MGFTIPDTAAAITPRWLEKVLGVAVAGVRQLDAHAGTTGRALLQLDYVTPTDLPPRLFVKLPPQDPAQRAFVCSSGMGRREAMFYRRLSAELPLRVPRCYHADWDESGEQYVMLLENLADAGCGFHNASRRYSLDYVRSVLGAFADLHAAYWESPRFESGLHWVGPPVQHPIAVALIERALGEYSAEMPPVFTELGELYLAHTDAIHRLWGEGAVTLVHGDVHDGNLFSDGDRPGFLDWALLARAPGMRDVGYFLAGTLTPEHQREYGRALVDYYRERLRSQDVAAPPLEELQLQYRWHAAYVWVGATVTLAMGDSWQPLNYVVQTLQRLHLALEELETVAALRTGLVAA